MTKQIEHDPDENRWQLFSSERRVWVYAALVLAAGWVLFVSTEPMNWRQVALGFGTGVLFLAAALRYLDPTPGWKLRRPKRRD